MDALFAKKDYDGAIDRFQRAKALDPKNAARYTRELARAYNESGYALLNKDKYAEAIKRFQQAVKFDPKLSVAYSNWGYALLGEKQYDSAIAGFQDAVRLVHRSSLPPPRGRGIVR